MVACGGSTLMTALELRYICDQSWSADHFSNKTLLKETDVNHLTFKVGPVPVLVMSLLFIACVFMLHIWGKYNRA